MQYIQSKLCLVPVPKRHINFSYKLIETLKSTKLSRSITLVLLVSTQTDAHSVKHSDSKSVTWESKRENRGKWISLLILYLFSQALSIGLSHFPQWPERGHIQKTWSIISYITKGVLCFKNCSDLLSEKKNVIAIEKKLLKSQPELMFRKSMLQTVKGHNNLWNVINWRN